jgi:putative transposase
VYQQEKLNREVNESNIVGIDMGVNNLCSLTSNKLGLNPILINGRIAKSMNQYYNKWKAYYQSKLPYEQYTSKRIVKLTSKRK